MKGYNGLPPYISITLIVLGLLSMIASGLRIIDSNRICVEVQTVMYCHGQQHITPIQIHPLMEG